MSDKVKLWCFLLLIPFFAAIGHDIYANFLSNDEQKARLEAFEIDPAAYQNSDLGYLLVKYVPTAYEATKEMVGEDTWSIWVDPILRLYSFIVALVPAVMFYIWLLISRIFDIWPFSGTLSAGQKTKDVYARDRDKEATFKYKRR